MRNDPYLDTFDLLDLYVYERSVNEAFAELGGIERDWPQLDGAVISSCHISHYLSNDLEQKWNRALHLELTCLFPAAGVHNRFRAMANEALSITFAGADETVLCTDLAREVLKAEAFDGAGPTQVFLSSQLSGFDAEQSLGFVANPLGELTAANDLTIRLVSARSSRPTGAGKWSARKLEQRWAVANVKSAMSRLVAAADGNRWAVEKSLTMTEAGPQASLRHIPSSDIIQLDAVFGYGQMELRAIHS